MGRRGAGPCRRICGAVAVTLLSFAAAEAQEVIGAAWEFDGEGDLEGWAVQQDLTDLVATGGMLQGTVTGRQIQLSGPETDIAAADFGFLLIRMKILRSSTALLSWNSDSSPLGFFSFAVVGDGLFHEYAIPLHTAEGWRGIITRLRRLTFNSSLQGTGLRIDYIRLVRLGPRIEIEKFRPKRIVPKAGEVVPLELIVRNTGDTAGGGSVRLVLPADVELVAGEPTAGLAFLETGEVDTVWWEVAGRSTGRHPLRATIPGQRRGKADSTFRIDIVDRRWEQERFFLSAWGSPLFYLDGGPRSFARFGEAHFRTLLVMLPEEHIIERVAEFGMQCLVAVTGIAPHQALHAHDFMDPPRLTSEHFGNLDEIIDRFRDNPTVIGYYIVDEPNVRAYQNIAAVVEHIRRRDPTRLSYVNQHPSSAGPAWFGPRTYREVLEHFLDVIKLELLSYDRYTFFKGGDGPMFFADLAAVRQVALDYDVPFANIVQAVGSDLFNWRTPTVAEHRWLAYNSLAYGAKSLMWYEWSGDHGAVTGPEGEQLFASIQSVNAEVNLLGPHMMPLRSVGAYHVGGLPVDGVALPDTVLVRSVTAAADMVVGLFVDESGNDYFMVVNDYREGATAEIALDREIDELLTLDVEAGRVVSVPFENRRGGAVFAASFRAGAGRLYFMSRSTAVTTAARGEVPTEIALWQNYPNPFNPATTITYELAATGLVTLIVYDALGQVVDVAVREQLPAGRHSVRWSGSARASGTYFYKLESDGRTLLRKMVLLK